MQRQWWSSSFAPPAFAGPCLNRVRGLHYSHHRRGHNRYRSEQSSYTPRHLAKRPRFSLRGHSPLLFLYPSFPIPSSPSPSSQPTSFQSLNMSLGPLSFILRPAVLNLGDKSSDATTASAANQASAATSDSTPGTLGEPLQQVDLAATLRASIQDVYASYVSASGVDYGALATSDRFVAYKSAAEELVRYDAEAALRTDAARVAFFVNLYNALTIHAFTALGPPSENSVSRLMFNTQASYRIGASTFSLSDIENGILRRNRGVAIWPAPFSPPDDPRLRLCVAKPDPRIHFVLNCGAASCPPIRYLVAELLEEQLSLATSVFLDVDSNFSIAPAGSYGSPVETEISPDFLLQESERIQATGIAVVEEDWVVTLNAIFKWYKPDFAPHSDDASVLAFVAANAGEDSAKAKVLRALLAIDASASNVTVRHAPYDWSLNSYKSV